MNIRPILSSLLRHKSAVAILLAEVALTCAILCNALFLIQRRLEAIHVKSGVQEASLLHISLTGIGEQQDAMAQTRADLAAMKALPGVANASLVSQLPLTNSSWNSGVTTTPDSQAKVINATMYMGDEAMLDTFGLKLSAGRAFSPDEFLEIPNEAAFNRGFPKAAIITRKMADALYPGGNAVGKAFYMGSADPITIVGLVDSLRRPGNSFLGDQVEYSMLLPVHFPYTLAHRYIVSVRPGADPKQVLDAVVAELKKQNPRRVILDKQGMPEMRHAYFAQDRSMVALLSIVCLVLLIVTAFGIVGLASFWVQQRTKQIGVRRALGATRGQIVRYFQLENFLIVTVGVVLGMLLAYGINQLLMGKYELPRLPWFYLPVGAVALWLLGQFAVLWPALHAASIPPATATRSV